MPLVYVLVLISVVAVGDSFSPIGQQPLWRQALGLFSASPMSSGSDTLYQRQVEWEKNREKRAAERKSLEKQRQTQQTRQQQVSPTRAGRASQGIGHAGNRPSEAEMRRQFRDISNAINR